MMILNFQLKPTSAFTVGVLKGLGAPLLIYGQFEGPVPVRIDPVTPQYSQNALADDWRMVGGDIRRALKVYGESAKHDT